MSTAMMPSEPPVRSVARCIEGVLRGTMSLGDDFGVTIMFDDLDIHTGGEWNPENRTLKIRRNSTVDDSALLVSEVWRLLNIGIHATQAKTLPRPRLTLLRSPPSVTQ